MLYSPSLMHIPDGFLSFVISIVLWIISIIVIGYATKQVSKDLGERQVPLMGVLAAAIFAGQMLNFAVVGGTSGHLLGAALATILLGPWAAMLIMTSVVSVQALIFQDGGLVALGANIFNMAIVGVAVAYAVSRTVLRLAGRGKKAVLAAGFSAAWFSVLVSSLAIALQLAASGTSPANLAVPAMAGVHALIGIGEGLITVGALAFLTAVRPDLIQTGKSSPIRAGAVWVIGLLVTFGLLILSPLASTRPDGLEKVAQDLGYLDLARAPLYELFPNYLLPGISSETVATIAAGIVGAVIVFGVALGVAYARRNRHSKAR
jgi:cobalt/nickel transport system permease protein